MNAYDVTITETTTRSLTFYIDADDENSAAEIARELNGDPNLLPTIGTHTIQDIDVIDTGEATEPTIASRPTGWYNGYEG